jgi:ribosome-associated toxin RatA of RatAB toxin-antitoxin module
LSAHQEGDLELRRSVLVPYTAEGMFDLIEHAEDYPKFLPWCVAATILERNDDWVAARIEFSYLKVRFGFQTRNPKRRPEWLNVRLVEGPFRHFQADWRLRPLGHLGCKVEFDLAYEVSDSVLDRMAAKAVDVVSRSMMDAFMRRAEATLPPIVALPPPTPAPMALEVSPVAPALAAPMAAPVDDVPAAGAAAPQWPPAVTLSQGPRSEP